MNPKSLIPFLLLLLSGLSGLAQPTQNYEPLRAEGDIPASILIPSSRKYEKEIAGLLSGSDEQKAVLNDQKRFALNSNFAMDDLLKSGLVLFNDPVSGYLNAVAQHVIGANPGIRADVEVYALRSTEVNAFASDRGEIFVTLGLIAQLENEAQLAFILSHELAHVTERHAQDKYVKSKNIDRGVWEEELSSDYDADNLLIRKSRYSREIEAEADRLGLEYFLKTRYKASTLPYVFDVFQFAYLPFNELPMRPGFLGEGPFQPAAYYRLGKVKPIELNLTEEDAFQSHPGIEQRRTAMTASIDRLANTGIGEEYLISQERFAEVRNLARYELPALYLHYDRFPEALYHAYLLQTESPRNLYLQKIILQSLYMSAKLKNDPDASYESPNFERIEGESQQAHYFFANVPARDLSILALRYGWNLLKEHPQDPDLKIIVADLFIELNYYVDSLAEFVAYHPAEEAAPSSAAPADTSSKYGKLRQMKSEQGLNPDSSKSWVLAFPQETLSDTAFHRMFKEGKQVYDEREERRQYLKTAEGRSAYFKYKSTIKRNGYALDIDRIVIVSPRYVRIDAREGNAIRFMEKETGQLALRNQLGTISTQAQLQSQIIDAEKLSEEDIETFNDLRLLNEWFFEQGSHRELYPTPGYRQAEINRIADKYDTDFFLWTGIVSVREDDPIDAFDVCFAMVIPIAIPFIIADAAKVNSCFIYGVLMNVKTGNRAVLKLESFNQKDSPSFVQAQYYDMMRQISQKRP